MSFVDIVFSSDFCVSAFTEFKQALYGLGDQLSAEQIEAVFHDFGPNGESHVDNGELQWAFFNRVRLIAA